MSGYLTNAEDVGEVVPQQAQDSLLVIYLAGLHLHLSISSNFDRDFPKISGNEQTLYPLEGKVQPGDMLGEHVVAVTETVSFGQRRSGLWHGKGRLVVSNLLGNCNTQPINQQPTTHLMSYVDNCSTETGTCLCRREILF